MRLVSFFDQDRRSIGVRVGDEVIDLAPAGLPDSLDSLFGLGAAGLEAARKAVTASGARFALSEIRLAPPIRHPQKAIAVGLNYLDHANESAFKDAPPFPVLFHRFPSSWVGHEAALIRPSFSKEFDYEAELVAVIGTGGRMIDTAHALEHVAGYSLFNEGSVRDWQFKSHQWMIGKNFDQSGSFGPELVTADELPPGAHGLWLESALNGETVQRGNTRDMIFDVATLVHVCSQAMALSPGDLIITGTPAGVGWARRPQLFMKSGDTFEVSAEGIAPLINPIREQSPVPAEAS